MGGPESIRYSNLDQINRANVQKLEVAWTYDTGDAFPTSEMQCNPIMVNGLLFATTPNYALSPWIPPPVNCDGASNYNEGAKMRAPSATAASRIGVMAEMRVFSLCRATILCARRADRRSPDQFGDRGRVDLGKAWGTMYREISISAATPGIIYRDLFIGGLISDLPSPPGDIRAYDVRSGKLRWSFHTIPHPGEFGYDTWPKDAWKFSGSANNWAGDGMDAKSAAWCLCQPDRLHSIFMARTASAMTSSPTRSSP